MLAHHSRKVLLAAMLATALSTPALANDTTAQQTAVGQGTATESASAQDSPVVVKESYATVTNGPAAAPRTRPKVAATRQLGGGDYYRASGPPLILGIRH